MKNDYYVPQPIDTSDVELSVEVTALVEELAKKRGLRHVYRRGGAFGPVRNDEKKTHPCLVPYEQLSEEEKIYDRNTCVQSLKYIIKAGFSIVPNPQ